MDNNILCPICKSNTEKFNKGVRCSNTLFTDVALVYLKLANIAVRNPHSKVHRHTAMLAADFQKCSYVEFDKYKD